MRAFTVLQDQALPPGGAATLALSPTADLLAVMREAAPAAAGVDVLRFLDWSRVFSRATHPRTAASSARWSPDGKLVAFAQPPGLPGGPQRALHVLAVEQECVYPVGGSAPQQQQQQQPAAGEPPPPQPSVPLHWVLAGLPADLALRGSGGGGDALEPAGGGGGGGECSVAAYLGATGAADGRRPLLAANLGAHGSGGGARDGGGGGDVLAALAAVLPAPAALPPLLCHEAVDGSLAAAGDDVVCDGAGGSSFSAWDAEDSVERAAAGGGRPPPAAAAFSGIWGLSSDVRALLAARPLALPVLCTVAWLPPPPALLPASVAAAAPAATAEPAVLLLAHGAIPLLRMPVPPPALACGARPLPLSLSASPTCASVLCASLVNGGGDFRALQLTLSTAPGLARLATALPQYVAVVAAVDAATKHAARAAAFARDEWAAAMRPLTQLLQALEAELPRFEPDARVAAAMGAAARAAYPASPVPLAAAELWRTLTVGASSGALQHWAETVAGGEAGLGKVWRAVEGACASVEQLLVLHVGRAADAALFAAEELRGAVAAAAAEGSRMGCGVLGEPQQQQLAALVATAGQLGQAAELARAGVVVARATYGALFVWLRLLARRFTADFNDSLDWTDAGQTPEAVAKRRAGRVPYPQPAEMALVQAALTPTHHGGGDDGVDADMDAPPPAVADPLGLGLGGSPFAAPDGDPLGLGLSSGLHQTGGAAPAALDPDSVAQPSGGPPAVAAGVDPFLSLSVSSVLGGASDAVALRALAVTPMTAYAGALPTTTTSGALAAAQLPAVVSHLARLLQSLVGSEAHAMSQRGATTATLLSLPLACDPDDDASRGGGAGGAVAVMMAAGGGGGGGDGAHVYAASDRLHARMLSRAVVSCYDDGEGWEWPMGDGDSAGAPPCSAGVLGSHLVILPVAPEVTPAADALPPDGGGGSGRVGLLILRLALTEHPDSEASQVAMAACVVTLPPSQRLLGGAFYGPAPGALAAAHAMADAAGGGFAVAPTVASDKSRQVTLVLGDHGANGGSPAVIVRQLQHRALPWVSVPAAVLAAGASDAAFLLEHLSDTAAQGLGGLASLGDVATRSRILDTGVSIKPFAWNNSEVSLPALTTACAGISLDTSGPRGTAALVVNGRRLVVLDMEEDEEEVGCLNE